MAVLTFHFLLEQTRGAILVLWSASLIVVAVAAWLATRRAQSRWHVVELQRELREEKARHALSEMAHEKKLHVYRTAALRRVVADLLDDGEKAGAFGKPRLVSGAKR